MAERETQPSPIGLLEELDEQGPLVGILVGSESDLEAMDPALAELRERGISHELKVLSAHRNPRGVAEYSSTAQLRGVRVWGLTPGVHADRVVSRGVRSVRAWGLTQNVHHR